MFAAIEKRDLVIACQARRHQMQTDKSGPTQNQ
jgi:hypothetical protein